MAPVQMESLESKTVTWELENWNISHELFVTAQNSCFVEMANPKASFRFFLKPVTKRTNIHYSNAGVSVLAKWYSLYVEVLNFSKNAVIKVNAKETNNTTNSSLSGDGYFLLSKAKGKEMEVIEEFIHLNSGHLDTHAVQCTIQKHGPLQNASLVIFAFALTSYQTKDAGKSADGASPNSESEIAEISLVNDLKTMFVADNNFSDLKLETKDNTTLNAHKFQLAARSSVLRRMIEEAVMEEGFEGTLKVEVNAKPMMVILHWMYTGELHENAGKVIEMEELVDMAIKWELTHLLTLLDKKLITICTKENMFRLYQVAQKTAMPTAMEDISAYIRQNV